MKCVFLDSEEFVPSRALVKKLEECCEVKMFRGNPSSEEEALERIGDAEIVVFAIMHISNAMLDRMSNVKIIQFIGTGVTTFLDIPYANSLGIQVLNIEGYGSNAVAEFTLGAIFNAVRFMSRGDRLVRSGIWDKAGYEGIEVEGATVGVVGTGNIGEIVAKKLSLLGAVVYGYDLIHKQNLINDYGVVYWDNLTEMASQCDILTVHLKVNSETMKMISREVIHAMPDGSFLVNIARAEVVDTQALFEAVQCGHIRSAAVDVYDQEPPTDCCMMKHENFMLTPHVGFYSKKASDNAILMVCDSVLSGLERSGSNGWR